MANPVARINLDALKHNYRVVQQAAPGHPVFAVIKANAYGHGSQQVAEALDGLADGFAVARVEEGIALRQQGFRQRILVLGGFTHPVEIDLALSHQLDVTLHDDKQLDAIELWDERKRDGLLSAWIKIDSGMHRLGFYPDTLEHVFTRVAQLNNLTLAGTLTHFANADDLASDHTRQQLETVQQWSQQAPEISLANSAAILGWPETHAGWLRPGIMLYGSSPFIHGDAKQDGLQPVMTLRTKLIAVHTLQQGDAIGYGSTWTCPEDMTVGVAGIGYGDGYPRHAPSGTPVLVNGKRVPIIGRVSMDMITLDLRQVPGASVGDQVTLWGEGLPADEIAAHAGTISYELFCRLTGRIKYRYEASPDG